MQPIKSAAWKQGSKSLTAVLAVVGVCGEAAMSEPKPPVCQLHRWSGKSLVPGFYCPAGPFNTQKLVIDDTVHVPL
ncbi:hypothetical protein WJX72_012020 [[Myrmecia] bisecta]|uniref:Secreted protein n=1 Tax=[Myrmecia] bisecta TaxID=41462 RepID=A0AAW1PHF6_9CHLO